MKINLIHKDHYDLSHICHFWFISGGKHLSATEKATLINLIRTLDRQNLLRDHSNDRDPEIRDARRQLWNQIVTAFNEISGRNCGLKKLNNAFHRVKINPKCEAYALLYEDV